MKKIRLTVQLLYTAVTNGYLYGFLRGNIYKGSLEKGRHDLPGMQRIGVRHEE